MMHRMAKRIPLPLEIPAGAIGLPTRGAEVTKCTLFHTGDKDPEPFSRLFDLAFPADVYKYEGVIHPVDPRAPDIRFEAGMPLEWNGKLIQQGGSGVNGFVPPSCMPLHGQDRERASALQQGYAVFGSDSGHDIINGNMLDCSWMMNQECFENFAYHSLKKTKDVMVYLTEQVYGKKADRVYFYGGSNGGRECIKAIQNYPEDYDGAVCFFPVLYWVLKVLMDARNGWALEETGGLNWIDRGKWENISQVIMDICDGLDGAEDHIISNIKAASEKRSEIEAAVRKIVTSEQFGMLEMLASPMSLPFQLAYGDVRLPGYPVFEGTPMFSHFEVLAEAYRTGQRSVSDNIMAAVFAQDPDFDTHQFEPEEWKDRIREISRWMDAYDANLDAFAKKAGKLILVQGTVDPQVTYHGTVRFYEKLRERYGEEKLGRFMKFYLAPGYGHGTDGTFLITSDFLSALDKWVEEEKEPENLVVTDRSPESFGRTSPLYEYTYYEGQGSID